MRLFDMLKRGRLTSTELIDVFYGDDQPYHARQIVMGTLRSLMRKMKANKEKANINRIKIIGQATLQFEIEVG